VIKKTSQKAGWILRTFRSRDLNIMRTLWRTLDQPHQDYASQLWALAGLAIDIMAQEGRQRGFTRNIAGIKHLPCSERLLSVERRQE
jgi:hypothetical protein